MTELAVRLDRSPGTGSLAVQLAEQLRAGIRSGQLAAGLRLPATRVLATDLAVSRGVVVAAYDQLTAEGFLVARQGDGTRVASLPHAGASQAGATPTTTAAEPLPVRANRVRAPYNLLPGTPDLSAFPRRVWQSVLRQVLAELPSDALGYPDPAGEYELRAELASYLRRVRAADADPERLIVVGGVAHGMASIGQLLYQQGIRRVGVEHPTSDGTSRLLRTVGLEPVDVPVDDEGVDVEALTTTNVHAVIVTPAHQYPTGVVLSPARRAELAAWARARDGLVMEDDYDAEFRYDRDPVGCLQGLAPDHVVLLGSVSKSLAPGLRLGWAVTPEPLGSALREWRAYTDLGSPVLEQYALARMLASGEYDRHLRGVRRTYRRRRDTLVSALGSVLPTAKVHGISAGVHVYVELPGYDLAAVHAHAAASGLAVQAAAGGLVLGYARLGERRLVEAARLLGTACAAAASKAHGPHETRSQGGQ